MAEKKSAMGDDPLAWLADGDEAPKPAAKKAPAKKAPAKKAPAKRTRVRRSTAATKAKAEVKTEVEIVEETFAALAPQGEALAARFYERLFEKYPETVPLFEDISITGQQKKLLASLVLLVQNLRNTDVLTEYLQGLGARHVQYGVMEDDYPKVAENLLAVMEEFAGDLWTPDVQAAWGNTLNTVATIMLEAYEPAEADDMAISRKQATEQAEAFDAEQALELARLSSAVNGSATAMMMINRDFEITFVNQATITMLRPYEDTLAEIFPGFDLDGLIGRNIDDFHKNPKHQRKLLDNPKNLPYVTDIQVGPLTFQLNVAAMMDGKDYIGCALEWANVTEVRAKEIDVARLSGTIDGAMSAIMNIDRDFNITYVNDATITMLRPYEDTLVEIFPGFDLDNLVGANIDQFHKDPKHQRKLLDDPKNCPYTTDINVGPLTFNLNVTAIMSPDGDYMGNGLEWKNVTTERQQQVEMARLNGTIDGAMTAIMNIDRDFNITYVNEATITMLRPYEDTLVEIFPGFDLDNLVGANIDQFHKDPKHQRKLLDDPKNCPYTTDIQVGPLTFNLNVTAIMSPEGDYMGNGLEWKNVTTERQQQVEMARLNGTIDGAMTAIMNIDRDFNITYVNDATLNMLRPYLDTLKEIFPGFDLDNLVGANIDQFHKNPAHQRKLLDDPNNLPYSTDISVGPLQFNLNVTAILSPEGEYMGNGLEWTNVTEQRAKEIEVARLESAVSGASTALMLCDADRVITYCNPAVVNLLQNRITELRQVFPGLDLDKIIGAKIDDFHKDPSHQARILADVNNLPYNTQIELVGLHFDLTATAILDPEGNLMGNMVEWKDITEQTQGEQEIQTLIQSAQSGKLEERIDSTVYQGFMQGVAQGMNDLLDAVLAPIQETIRVAEAMASGDLTQNLDGDYEGMFDSLSNALNETVEKMLSTVTDINEAAVSIGTGATEITRGNVDLSQRTEEQASSLEETASSMEELTSTVRQNSDNAAQANQLAASAREQAEKGGSVIKEAIDAMAAISSSSKKVTDIIGVIDEIAFQTNLLALNAAVEAARAGEQGRGFAVVASEVRNLAQRSAAAAKEIKELINDSGEKVKEGSMLVDESGRTLEDIVSGAKKVGDIISEIAAAGAEQTSGIGQVNTAVGQMDEMTQQNAALVEEAAAASESLDEQGKNLQRMMAFFNVGAEQSVDVEDAPAAKAAPKAAPKRRAAKKPAAQKAPPAADAADDEWDEF